jgi:hypothetical protein
VATGPRIDPGSLPAADGLGVNGYVHELWRGGDRRALAQGRLRPLPVATGGAARAASMIAELL